MLPNVIEFYNYNDELWYRTADGSNNRYEETSIDITDFMIEYIDKFYPKAYEALSKEYDRCNTDIALLR